jgi:hypothetical protein
MAMTFYVRDRGHSSSLNGITFYGVQKPRIKFLNILLTGL